MEVVVALFGLDDNGLRVLSMCCGSCGQQQYWAYDTRRADDVRGCRRCFRCGESRLTVVAPPPREASHIPRYRHVENVTVPEFSDARRFSVCVSARSLCRDRLSRKARR